LLSGATRKEALAKEPENFLEFRRLWEEALAIAMDSVNDKILPDKLPYTDVPMKKK
jgi:hypothetical protein